MSYSNSNNHPGDRSNVYDDNRHCDDDVDDEVLGSCLDTYKEWSTEFLNTMLDDQMQYENSKDSRAGMFDDYGREKILRGKIVDVNKERKK